MDDLNTPRTKLTLSKAPTLSLKNNHRNASGNPPSIKVITKRKVVATGASSATTMPVFKKQVTTETAVARQQPAVLKTTRPTTKHTPPQSPAQKALKEKEQQVTDKTTSKAAWKQRMALVKSLKEKLCTDYPTVFNKAEPKPLAVGIHWEVFAKYPEYSRLIVRTFLRRWTLHPRYVAALQAPGANRYNLLGEVVGIVLPTEVREALHQTA